MDGPWPAFPFVLGVRNGTNARAFRTWSGLTAAEATIHVKSHLLAVLTWYTSQKQEALKRKVLKLRDEISENIVVIASCKTMQCLRTDTRRELGSGTQTHQTPLLTSHMQLPTPPPSLPSIARNFCWCNKLSHSVTLISTCHAQATGSENGHRLCDPRYSDLSSVTGAARHGLFGIPFLNSRKKKKNKKKKQKKKKKKKKKKPPVPSSSTRRWTDPTIEKARPACGVLRM